MKTLFTISLFFLFLSSSLIFSQSIIFEDNFESGTASSEWGQFWAGEDAVQAIPIGDAKAPLEGGGDYVGYLQDVDASYTGSAMAVAGDVTSANYSIEADVYCYVNHPEGSAYTGLAFYADSSINSYLKLVADFDGNQRMRLYNNHLDFTTFQYSFHHEFTAADMPNGIPTEDGWHHMKVEVRTVSEDTTAFWCYFDGELIGGSPVYDTSVHVRQQGRFGLFSFQQSATGIEGNFDNVVVKELAEETDADFADNFESGSPDASWGVFWPGEDEIQAVAMGDVPAPLETGGEYVGYLQDIDASYTGSAQSVVDDIVTTDYAVEADVYCYVNHPGGSAYTGIVVHSDSSVNTYIKMVADFDGNQRMRLYNNHLDFTTFQYSFSHDFTAADFPDGIPTEDGWHKMKIEARVIDETKTGYWCYFDGELLGGSPIYDTSSDRMTAGRYGVFAFQQSETGIAGYFDNFMMKKLEPIVSVKDDFELQSTPTEFALEQNYPNPFNPATNISYQINSTNHVSLVIYDILGNKVKELVSKTQAAGYYTAKWNGTNEFGSKVNSGFYIYTLKSGQLLESRKMILMK